ncbi:hypothetical protein GCM10023261_12330 [Bartonella jaculi]|uniref:50S ribosomal protein L33 n=1 Tax=Bartonella jaculi TaxID=686226 RepID=A0ABP9N7P2_9HYPH
MPKPTTKLEIGLIENKKLIYTESGKILTKQTTTDIRFMRCATKKNIKKSVHRLRK